MRPATGLAGIKDPPKNKIELCFACRELVDLDVITKTDPFLKVYEKLANQWNLIGQSEVVYNNLNPEFNERFKVDFYFEEVQPFKVEVYHHNSATDLVYIGEVEFNLSNLTGIKDNTLEKPIIDRKTSKPNRGMLLARFDLIARDTEIKLKVTGFKLKSNYLCMGRNKNFLQIHKPRNPLTVPGFVSQRTNDFDYCKGEIPEAEWALVVKTNHLPSDNPNWPELVLQKMALCSDQEQLPIRLEVWDYKENSGNHKLVGGCIKTFEELRKARGGSIQIWKKNRTPSGELRVEGLTETRRHAFEEYLKGGLNVSLIIGIDFTQSNKDPYDPTSLHRKYPAGSSNLNPYQQVITQAAEILLEYDSDKKVPVLGFGGVPLYPQNSSTSVSHCFPCNGNFTSFKACEVDEVPGIFEAYNTALQCVQLSGPTMFSPLIDNVLKMVQGEVNSDPISYFFFMIITDGFIIDMQATKDLIVKACNLPISFVIVGVGSGPFDNMDELDEGDFLDTFNKKPPRDICRFVEFSSVQNNPVELRKSILKEIPMQVEQYFALKGIPPNPPLSKSYDVGMSAGGFRQPRAGVYLQPLGPGPIPYNPNNRGTIMNTNPGAIQPSRSIPPELTEITVRPLNLNYPTPLQAKP